jgi:hypothetical protein
MFGFNEMNALLGTPEMMERGKRFGAKPRDGGR